MPRYQGGNTTTKNIYKIEKKKRNEKRKPKEPRVKAGGSGNGKGKGFWIGLDVEEAMEPERGEKGNRKNWSSCVRYPSNIKK